MEPNFPNDNYIKLTNRSYLLKMTAIH